MQVNMPTWSIGSFLAVIVLILSIVFYMLGRWSPGLEVILIAMLALARLT